MPGARLNVALEPVSEAALLELLRRDLVLSAFTRVVLGGNKENRSIGVDGLDLVLESVDAVERCTIVGGDAKHEAVGVVVGQLAVHAQLLVSARVDNLYLYWLAVELALTREHVEHRGNVVLIELACVVCHNQASLTDGRGSTQDDSDAAGSIVNWSLVGLRPLPLF